MVQTSDTLCNDELDSSLRLDIRMSYLTFTAKMSV